MTIWTNPVRRVEGLFLEDYSSSPGEYLSARSREAWERNPLPSGQRLGEIEQARGPDPTTLLVEQMEGLSPERPAPSPMLSAEEANARGEAMGLKFSQPTRTEVVDIMVRRKKAEVARQSIMQRSPGGLGLEAGALGLELLTTAADPLNIASAFIPVVREARFANWARNFGPTAARFARGTIEGGVGAAIVEPIILAAATQEQADYDMMDSLLNIAFGTALGGGLHVGGGALADVVARRTGGMTLSERLQQAPHEVREAALRTAVAQIAEGRVVDVEPLLSGNRLLDSTSLSTRTERFRPEVAAEGTISGPVSQRPEAPDTATLVALETTGGQRRVYADEARARRESAKAGEGVRVAERPEGGFVLQRETAVEPLREPSGAVRAFANERAARRFIGRTAPDETASLQVVPFGPAGERRWAVVRNATERDLGAMRASPERVRFSEVQRDRVTRQEPTALLTRSAEPTLNERLAKAVESGRDPRSISVADFRAAERAEEIVKQIPVDETAEVAEAFLDDAAEQVDGLRLAMGISDEEFAKVFADLDAAVVEAQALGKAARAAALCDLRR